MYQFTSDCLTGIGILDDEHRGLFTMIMEIFATLAIFLDAFCA